MGLEDAELDKLACMHIPSNTIKPVRILRENITNKDLIPNNRLIISA
jgi:hypothetical protein